jgi:hypothetical protein
MQIKDSYNTPEWAKNIVESLKEGKLLEDKKDARKTRMQTARYTLVGDVLYCRGYTLPLLKCLLKAKAEYVLREIHEGVCGSHSGGRMLLIKLYELTIIGP